MAEWTEKRIPEFAMTVGHVEDYEKEIQPLRKLAQEYFGEDVNVEMSWRKESASGIVYYCPETSITIHGKEAFRGTLLACAQALLRTVGDIQEDRHSDAE